MSVLNQLASANASHSDVPNQELAKSLAESRDLAGIKELADNLQNKNKDIASDCIKTLYEIGYLNPELIQEHVDSFLKILHSRNNRLVWGGMIALSTIADKKSREIFGQFGFIAEQLKNGSIITVDNAVLVLAKISAVNKDYEKAIFPILLQHLKGYMARQIPQHAEKTLWAVNPDNREPFIGTLEGRMNEMTPSQASRLKKVIRAAQKR